MRSAICVATAGIALALAQPVCAGPLPPVGFGGDVQTEGIAPGVGSSSDVVPSAGARSSFGTEHAQSIVPGVTAIANAFVGGGPSPSVQVYASDSSGLNLGSATAGAEILYSAEIVGPADISVPVYVKASGLLESTVAGSLGGQGELTIGGSAGQFIYQSFCWQLGCYGSITNVPGFSISASYPFETNETIDIEQVLTASSVADEDPSVYAPGGELDGFVTASLTLDPSFVAAGYSIIYSEGVLAAPEPTSLTLFGVGLLGLHRVRRRTSERS